MDVRREHRRHLAPLNVADAAFGMEHEDADMLAPRDRLDRRRSGIARRRPDDRDIGIAAAQEFFEQLAEQLQRDVLERERRPVKQFEPPVAMVELDERRDRIMVASAVRSEEHTSELTSLMRISYAVFCLKKKKK